jgi:hypothetical protein
MQYTYLNTVTSSTTPASVVSTASIVLRKLLIGNPVSGGSITIHYTGNALANDTTTIAWKMTLPAFSSTYPSSTPMVVDFRAASGSGGAISEDGLSMASGCSIVLDQTMQVLALWDLAQE